MEEEPTESNIEEKSEAEEPTKRNIEEKCEAEEPTQSNAEEKNEAEAGPAGRENKRDEKREKIIKKVKEVLAQSPNKAKNPTVIVICYRGKKKRNPSQAEKKDETGDHSTSPNNTQ
ncbi:ubiquitin carboxyl-terminal hydrolase puf-like [Rattus norvegicus]|uniref:ubiquitin carboxyl-terminal hydrolase puf-like n=1 Tax=Rattus norvegicus TaxID=10116 RepID=UPI0000DA459B|nr:ubiquitin carboxyl-terminal hydrolase puf-like [Rattus norvegicus]